MNMCTVASGQTDAYWEFGLHAWDIAAADLIIREAGGVVMSTDGKHIIIWRAGLWSLYSSYNINTGNCYYRFSLPGGGCILSSWGGCRLVDDIWHLLLTNRVHIQIPC